MVWNIVPNPLQMSSQVVVGVKNNSVPPTSSTASGTGRPTDSTPIKNSKQGYIVESESNEAATPTEPPRSINVPSTEATYLANESQDTICVGQVFNLGPILTGHQNWELKDRTRTRAELKQSLELISQWNNQLLAMDQELSDLKRLTQEKIIGIRKVFSV
jgi:hypothetical protein